MEILALVEVPEELHLYAVEHNWDGEIERLRMVVVHPDCDAEETGAGLIPDGMKRASPGSSVEDHDA